MDDDSTQDADAELARVAAAADGVFTLEQARLAGLSDREIEVRARTTWARLHRRVFRMPGAPQTWRGDLRAACFACEPHGVLSHRTAARLYGLPGGREDIIELTCPRWRRSQTSGLLVHESTLVHPRDVQLVDGLPVVRPELAALELASVYRSADFIERVLHAARRQRLITHESIIGMFERMAGRGRPGVQVLREALDRWPGTRASESEMETRLLQVLRRAGFQPVLQYEVYDDRGVFVARVDAALPDYRVLVEYDSMLVHSDEWSLARDASRRNRLLALGYQPLVARARDLRTGGNELTAAIRACIRRATPEPA